MKFHETIYENFDYDDFYYPMQINLGSKMLRTQKMDRNQKIPRPGQTLEEERSYTAALANLLIREKLCLF